VTGMRRGIFHQGLAGVGERFQPRQPRKPQVPLMVWTRRKIFIQILALFGSCSNRNQLMSTVSRAFAGLGQKLRNKSTNIKRFRWKLAELQKGASIPRAGAFEGRFHG